ncbi:MAG TPA: nucleoside hydrolase [Candidatus Acidoferrales bacterium]|nr:nucleoside hydrolase [Candidatus Acidoferrales bacterium]
MKTDRREFSRLCGCVMANGILSGPRSMLGMVAPARAGDAGVQKAILDTDPGVDDAFALFLAMRSELKVLAITAVAGNVPLSVTLPNTLRLVEIADRSDIPVAAGAASPLMRKLVTASYAHGNNGLAGVQFPAPKLQAVKEPAADLICRLVHENAGEISIIGIGPLTNVALALRQDPEIASMIRRIVLMGGSLSGGNVTPAAEFNFYVDPEAASIVFAAGIPIQMVGLDVTRKVQLTEQHVNALRAGKGKVSEAAARIAEAVMKMAHGEKWQGGPHLHDPLAVSSMIDREILTFEDYHVEIETSGAITAGESVGWKHAPLRGSAPLQTGISEGTVSSAFKVNAQVATGVDSEKFFQLLISRLTTEPA